MAILKPEDYSHSPLHYAVVGGDHNSLSRIVSSLPRLDDPDQIHTESDSISQERIAEQISAVLDRRDNPLRDTPLHLAIKLNDAFAVRTLVDAGADISLQNATGWNAAQEAVIRRNSDVIKIIVNHRRMFAWSNWRRRLPQIVAALRRMRDFYMEISFHFESSIVPLVGRVAPSDTYKIWKRDGNLRADTSLDGYDGLRVKRVNRSFLFLADGDRDSDLPPGSLLVLNHDVRKISDAFEKVGVPWSDSDIAAFCAKKSVYRPGFDVTKAEMVGRKNWRRRDKMESVGEWQARVYEMHNVVVSLRSRKIIIPEEDSDEEDSDEDDTDEDESDEDDISVSRNIPDRRKVPSTPTVAAVSPQTKEKEKEYVKGIRPTVWLTEQFPLKTEELLPLLDILANKVKAVRRTRELLTTKFPPGTFPVKIQAPVIPTVRVVITFTKFVELQPTELFFSPNQLVKGPGTEKTVDSSFSMFSWLRRKSGKTKQPQPGQLSESDPFPLPRSYVWSKGKVKKTKVYE